ncbi:hypothetical protein AKO1_008118 [Acrasis kona]
MDELFMEDEQVESECLTVGNRILDEIVNQLQDLELISDLDPFTIKKRGEVILELINELCFGCDLNREMIDLIVELFKKSNQIVEWKRFGDGIKRAVMVESGVAVGGGNSRLTIQEQNQYKQGLVLLFNKIHDE